MLAGAVVAPGILGGAPALGNFLVLPMVESFGVSRATVLFCLALGVLGYNFFLAIAGRILTSIEPWRAMLLGVVVAGAGLLGASAAPNFGLAIAGFLLANIVGAALCSTLTGQTLVVRNLPQRVGVVSGAQTVAVAAAGVALPLVVAPILSQHGWRFVLAAIGAFVLVTVSAIILALLRTRPTSSKPVEAEHSSGEQNQSGKPPTTVQILSAPAFWLLLLAIEPVAILAGALAANLIPFYHDRGVDLQHTSYVLAAIGLASALGALSVGFIADRIAPNIVMAVIATNGLAGMIAITLNLGALEIILPVIFFGLGGLSPALGVAMRRYFGAIGYAPALGLFAPFMMVSAFSGAGAGWMRDQFGSYQNVFLVLTVVMVIAFSASLLLLLLKVKPVQANANACARV